MSEWVRVEAPARIHFGFTNLDSDYPRVFGGLGVGVDEPRTIVEAKRSSSFSVSGGPSDFMGYVETAGEALGVEGADIRCLSYAPRHVGLGSGTQLALAVVRVLSDLWGVDWDLRRRAVEMGRGIRSGVGVNVFESGGFIWDAGHQSGNGDYGIPRAVSRVDVPRDWCFLFVVPGGARGVHGDMEEELIRGVQASVGGDGFMDVLRCVYFRVVPGLLQGDIELFGEGLTRVGRINGGWYESVQGGVYRECCRDVIGFFEGDERVYGYGQSSWGPGVYGLMWESDASAVYSELVDKLDVGDGYICRPDNSGGVVRY